MIYRITPSGAGVLTAASRRDRIFDTGHDDTIGWIPIAIAGASAALPFITGLFSACRPGQACGLAGITAFGQQVMATLGQIEQMLRMRPPMIAPAQAISEAGRVAGLLSDSNVIYQAKRGQDAAALQQFKQQAAAKVQEITALAGQIHQQSAQAAASSRQSGGISAGLSSNTLLLVGGLGLAAVLMLKRS